MLNLSRKRGAEVMLILLGQKVLERVSVRLLSHMAIGMGLQFETMHSTLSELLPCTL